MKFVLFCHAFTSCWNNGHAHFLRGVTRELIRLGHDVLVCEPELGWSRVNALIDNGHQALAEAERLVPGAEIKRYQDGAMQRGPALAAALDHADVVLAHEWNEPSLIAAIGEHRIRAGFRCFYLDAHHRAVTSPDAIGALALDAYDGILAFGEALREVYCRRGWGRRAFTWHEAADCALFHPRASEKSCDLIWIGNWGDDERSRELREFLIEPAARLQLRTRVHGVRYPDHAKALLRQAGIANAGWLPNHRVPEAFAGARVTVHIPRRAYNDTLPGIPTIRVFEALACGIPLVCAPWSDEEGLFPSDCYLRVSNGDEMTETIRRILVDPDLAADFVRNGLEAIRAAHTCRHRAEELLAIIDSLSDRAPQSVGQAEQPSVEAVP